MGLIKELKHLDCGKVISRPKMSSYTSFKVGGHTRAMVFPKKTIQLIKLLKYLKNNDVNYKVLGNGSNVIFRDCDYDLVIIKLDHFNKLRIINREIKVGAGYSLPALSLKAAKENLTGLEFASGIPGTIGGAILMNAGAYKSDMGYIVSKIRVITPELKVETMYNDQLDFHYRTSFLKENPGYICIEATLQLRRGKKEAIMEVIKDRKRRRIESQPLEYPSAGSVFRNPPNNFAGKLIEDVGFKGKRVGGAMVSKKHANFIINYNKATGDDVIELIEKIKDKVKKEYDIDLKVEQEIVK